MMDMMKTMLAAFAALSLAACASVPGTGGTTSSSISLATADEKALIAVEGTYRAVLIAVNAAVDSGVLRGEKAAKVSELLAKANSAVLAAHAARDGVTLAAKVSDATAALSGVRALIGK
jgi:hypothetical protein